MGVPSDRSTRIPASGPKTGRPAAKRRNVPEGQFTLLGLTGRWLFPEKAVGPAGLNVCFRQFRGGTFDNAALQVFRSAKLIVA